MIFTSNNTRLFNRFFYGYRSPIINTLIIVLGISLPSFASAFSGGIAGCTASPGSTTTCPTFTETQVGSCDNCHSGGSEPVVTLNGPHLVAPNSTHTYTMSISGGQQVAGGLNVSASSGSFIITDSGTRLINTNEVTHVSPRSADSNGMVSFSFDWTAPASGNATLYAAGNSVNRNGNFSGDNAATSHLMITVQANNDNQAPIADPNGPYQGITGQAIIFDGLGSVDPDGDTLIYLWSFGDGQTGMGSNPSHVYTMAGEYDVTLTVNDGQVDSMPVSTIATITDDMPHNMPPVADANGPYQGVTHQPISFNGSNSSDLDGQIVSYEWNFGDDNVATGAMPLHTYAAAGTYTVTLTVTDNEQLTDTTTTTAVVTDTAPPAASFGSQAEVAFANSLWKQMKSYRLVGDKAIHSVPYIGIAPHGEILETIDGVFEINITTHGLPLVLRLPLIVKKNYGGENVTVEMVANNPNDYLDAVTVMFKIPGYDFENKDWFWVRYDPMGNVLKNPDGIPMAGRVAKGMSTGCIACHSAAPGGDYVYIHDKYQSY